MFAEAVQVLFKLLAGPVVSAARKAVAGRIEEGDAGLGEVRQLIQTEIGKVMDALDRVQRADLETASRELQSGMTSLRSGNHEDAERRFENAQLSATKAMGMVTDFDALLKVTKIRVFTTMYLLGYFSGSYDRQHLRDECTDLFRQLLGSTPSSTAIEQEARASTFDLGRLAGGKGERRRIILALSCFGGQLEDYLDHPVPSLLQGNTVGMRALRSIRVPGEQRNSSYIATLAVGDGRIFSGHKNGTIRVWDLQTLEPVGEPLTGHADYVPALAVAGGRLFSVDEHGTIRVWDLQTLEPVGAPLTGHTDPVMALAVAGDRLFSGSWDWTIRVWDLQTLEPVGEPLTGHTDRVVALAVGEQRLFSGSEDGTIRVWDRHTLEPVGEPLTGYIRFMWALAVGGHRLFSVSVDGIINVWDQHTLKPVGKSLRGDAGFVWALAVGGHRLFSRSRDGTIRVWDLQTLEPVGKPLQDHSRSVSALAVGGGRLFTGSYYGDIREWMI